MLIMYC